GILGSLGVLVGLALTLPRLRHLATDLKVEPETGAWLLLIAIWSVVFLRLPHEIAYLIPVFPFGYLVMGRYMTRAVLAGVVAAIVLAGVVDITTPGEALNLDQVRSAQIGRGLILSNLDTMKTQRSFVEKVMAAPVPNHSVVMAGFIYPQLAM